jgi:hypothetical protein
MSATILTVIVLIVMWVVVLVPLLVRRAEESEEAAALWAPVVSGAGLPTETPAADADERVAVAEPARALAAAGVPAEPPMRRPAGYAGEHAVGRQELSSRRSRGFAEEHAGGPEKVSPYRDGAARPAGGRTAVLARRRRVLTLLAVLVLATGVAAVLWTPVIWVAHAVCDLLLVGYVGTLRSGARRQAQRPARLRQQQRPASVREPHPAPQSAPRPVANSSVRRQSQVIALDDEDPSFAQMDMRYPRAANE